MMDLKALSASILLALRGVPGQPCTVDLADEKLASGEREGGSLGGDLSWEQTLMVGVNPSNVQLVQVQRLEDCLKQEWHGKLDIVEIFFVPFGLEWRVFG